MKKFFFLALMAFLWLPATTWANDANEEFDDDEQEDYSDGTITSSSISLNYKILTVATSEEQNGAGTVELEGVATESASANLAALSIPHIIVHVELDAQYQAHTYYYTVTGIAQNAFYDSTSKTGNTTLTSVTIPYTVTYIGNPDAVSGGSFNGCTKLTTVTFAETTSTPSQLTSMGYQTFTSCSALTSIDIPSSVTSLGANCFQNCSSLTEVKLPESIPSLPSRCFSGCTNLTTVWMSGSVILYTYAFGDCGNLRAFVLEGDNPSSDGGQETGTPFYDDASDVITLYVPTGSAPAYLQTKWEKDRTNDEETLQWNFLSTDVSTSGWDGEEIYYATFYTDAVGEFGSDVTPNIVTNAPESGEITYSALNGYIPAGTGLLLTSDAAATTYYYHPYETTIGEVTTADVSGNMLYGSTKDEQTNVNGDTENYYFYKLSRNADGDSGSVGFYWANDTGGAFTCLAYKAYLAVPKDEATPTSYSFKKDEGDTTGISSIESASEKTVSGIYTIQGVRVSNMSQPGLYIVDGKKVLVK